MSQLRFGATDFVSARPLLYGLLNDESLRGAVVFEPAAAIVDSFGRGRCDAALVPTIEYLRGAGQYLLAGPALIGRSAPGGMVLVAQKPIDALERVAVGEFCRNAVAVLRIVLAENHSVFPDLLVEKRIDQDDWRERYDAVLLTGDAALRETSAGKVTGIIRYNLAEMWKSLTRTPLVHAVWVYNDRRLANEVSLLLTASRDEGAGRLPAVAEELARTTGFDEMMLYDHLSRAWSYDLGERELDGLRVLNDLARKYDLIRESRLTATARAR
ncbi:MAG TPA: MqnA/MqnD/SBP family protein [Candidatus Krumholzibacteria bacterium]|nr:MqnA/MqnD/SBP family protein [Candidatus Krumholzibacteria bacterium]